MRIALLPSSGNPYVLGMWLRSFQRFWRNEVDRLYAVVATPVEQPVMQYLWTQLARAGANLVIIPQLRHPVEHGEAISWLLRDCEDGILLLIEEDCFVLKPGEIDRCFRLVETGTCDVVASSREAASPNLTARSKQAFSLTEEPHFWPNLFFADKRMLEATDRDFRSRHWHKGEYVPLLDYTCEEDEHADTFVWASIQIRANGCRVSYIPQHHAAPTDAEDHRLGIGLFEAAPPWVHFGALAGGRHIMMDRDGLIICHRELALAGYMDDIDVRSAGDYEKRLAMWMLCRRLFPIGRHRAEYYNETFDYAASNVLSQKADVLSRARIEALTMAYLTLFSVLL